MKNFYEILEISQNASQEVVEKAYKTLVKKYHPDLQTNPDKKKECEAKIKELNEAYETISNSNLREKYNQKLNAEQNKTSSQTTATSKTTYQTNYRTTTQSDQQHTRNSSQTKGTTNQNTNTYNAENIYKDKQNKQFDQLQQQYKDAVKKAYQDAYVQKLRDMGYRVRYKKTPKQKLQSFLIVVASIIIIILICQLPFVKDYLHSLYESNPAIKAITDMFMNLFK